MHTYQISATVLEGYKIEKLSEERIKLLINQVDEQLDEMSQNKEIYNRFLKQVKAPQKIDKIILWILLMSNEDICFEYTIQWKKGFRDVIPLGDLADLLLYSIHLKKVKDIELDGLDYLLEYNHDGIEEMDQFAFTNALLYIQKSKEVEMEF
ncbi:MAG: hypothetical protein Q9M32_07750 [Sulfurimonas sp.]|nr:hypothetical protein [Sulfurimonas sp.]MDQ7062173.1 hypothetical protein [Sulfurimonas sp.]